MAEEKWRSKVGNGEVVLYREAAEDLTYKAIILQRLKTKVIATKSDIVGDGAKRSIRESRCHPELSRSASLCTVVKRTGGLDSQA